MANKFILGSKVVRALGLYRYFGGMNDSVLWYKQIHLWRPKKLKG